MTNTTPLVEPTPPEDWECCGSDCGDACVWALYYREKAAYDEQQQLAQSPSTPENPTQQSILDAVDSEK